MIYSDPSSPRADGGSHRLFLSIHLSIHPSIYLSVSPFAIHPSTSLSPLLRPPFSTSSLYLATFFLLSPFRRSCRFPTCETASSRYSWGSRIARGLVTRLRTHLLLARQLGPSVHQATILLISARIGLVAKCSQDYQFTMARGERRSAPSYTENNAKRRAARPTASRSVTIVQDCQYFCLEDLSRLQEWTKIQWLF